MYIKFGNKQKKKETLIQSFPWTLPATDSLLLPKEAYFIIGEFGAVFFVDLVQYPANSSFQFHAEQSNPSYFCRPPFQYLKKMCPLKNSSLIYIWLWLQQDAWWPDINSWRKVLSQGNWKCSLKYLSNLKEGVAF